MQEEMQSNMMSVTSLNTKIKSLLEATFLHIKVEGEVASVTHHRSSGHIYFSLKDDQSAIRCVMFRSNAQKLKFQLNAGEHIIVEGSIGVYTPRGEYQFYAVHIEPYGKGALALAFEQLKDRLRQKGYFDQERKKTIPKWIGKIAIVSAKESAAVQDMLKVIEKRWPLVSVTVIDTLVQGEQAPAEIAAALKYADKLGADVIIAGRGGGSTEDLWAFNDEGVAETIFALGTPIVSAVGHEVDFLISDFVADLRAPTPSAAIEMILPDKQELLYTLDEYAGRFVERIMQILMHKQRDMKSKEEELRRFSPFLRLKSLESELQNIEKDYRRIMEYKLAFFANMLAPYLEGMRQQLSFVLEQKQYQATLVTEQYTALNPRNRVKEGWAKVSINHKSVSLGLIEPGVYFEIENSDTKIGAICQNKLKF